MIGGRKYNDWWNDYVEGDFIWVIIDNIKWREREEIVFEIDCC